MKHVSAVIIYSAACAGLLLLGLRCNQGEPQVQGIAIMMSVMALTAGLILFIKKGS